MSDVVVLGAGLGGTLMTYELLAQLRTGDRLTLIGQECHVLSDSTPVLLDVWAPWCGPCRMMAPAFERAAATLAPDIRLLKLNADEASAVSARLGVRGIPAMHLFRNGKALAQTAGAMPADAIVRWTRDHLTMQPS